MIVVDTNIVASLLLQEDGLPVVRALKRREPHWAIPALLRSEVRNVCWKYLRRGALDLPTLLAVEAEAEALLRGFERPVPGARALALAASSGCTAYDCEFVALAESLEVPLVTWDRALLAAFPGLAVMPEDFIV